MRWALPESLTLLQASVKHCMQCTQLFVACSYLLANAVLSLAVMSVVFFNAGHR